MNPARLHAYIYLVITSFIWGIAAIVIKLTLKGIEPLAFLTYRFALSAIIGSLFLLGNRSSVIKLFKDKKILLTAIIYSLLATTIALGFLFIGLGKTTVLNLSLVDLTGPIMVAIFGVIFLKEHFTKQEKLGSIIAVTGALITLIGPSLLQDKFGSTLLGNLLIFLYVLTDATSSIFLKKLLRLEFSAFFLVNFSFIVAFIAIFPIALFKYSPVGLVHVVTTLPLPYHLGVWFMALASGTLGFYLRARAQKTIEIGEAGLFGYLISVFSAPLAILILNEKLTINLIVGAIIIIIGILIAETKKRLYN